MYAKNQLRRCSTYHTKRAVLIRSLRRRPYRMKPTAVGFISLTTVQIVSLYISLKFKYKFKITFKSNQIKSSLLSHYYKNILNKTQNIEYIIKFIFDEFILQLNRRKALYNKIFIRRNTKLTVWKWELETLVGLWAQDLLNFVNHTRKSNGSWRQGIKGKMSCTLYVALVMEYYWLNLYLNATIGHIVMAESHHILSYWVNTHW